MKNGQKENADDFESQALDIFVRRNLIGTKLYNNNDIDVARCLGWVIMKNQKGEYSKPRDAHRHKKDCDRKDIKTTSFIENCLESSNCQNMEVLDIKKYISVLEKDDRLIFLLSYKWGLKQIEIAELYGVSESRISQILKAIDFDKSPKSKSKKTPRTKHQEIIIPETLNFILE